MSWVTDPTQLSIRSQVTERDSGNTPSGVDPGSLTPVRPRFECPPSEFLI